jgi:uncharacterized protein YbaP (TraB family)
MLMTILVSVVSATEDVNSDWAYWDIFMASEIYQLGNEQTYSNFRASFTEAKFAQVHESLNNRFGTDDEINISNKNAVTRGEIISELYDIIVMATEIDGAAAAIDYFVQNKLIHGRANGEYQLEQTCTTEEMIALSVRVCEYISYKLSLDSSGLFWKITGKDMPNTVYLLGTIHAGDSSVYPFSRAMLAAFDRSAYLGVEANIYTISDEDMAYIEEMQFLRDGSTISDHISAETYEFYVEVFESLGVPAEIYDYLKPWAAMLTLTQILMFGDEDSAITSARLGMDMFFLAKAVHDGKEIVEIESIKYQMDMFDSYSPELQEYLLSALITPSLTDEEAALSMEEQAEIAALLFSVMLEAVKTGDEAALVEIIMAGRDYTDPLLNEYNTKLFDIRDADMAEAIVLFLADEDAAGDFFVAVGAGHTVGETGIVHVLREKGYNVVRVK